MDAPTPIGRYLIDRLCALGVRHVFGVPGDYVLAFFGDLADSPLSIINTCDEQGAGFAADAYARVNGIGAVCVTYCVGGLKLANTTAQAFAEKSPVVVISGAPGTSERAKNLLLHHKVRDFGTQFRVFEQLTCAATVLDDPQSARREIDRVLGATVRYKRPCYIELPRDMVRAPAPPGRAPAAPAEGSNPDTLREALREAVDLIERARQPVIIAGVELHRFGLQDVLVQLVDATGIPVTSTLLSKSVVAEAHPAYLGVYEGAIAHEDVRAYVESSDCLVLLGAPLSDIDLGIFTARLEQAHSISVTSEKTSIRFHTYEEVRLEDFVRGLLAAGLTRRTPTAIPRPARPTPFVAEPGRPVTVERLFQRLNAFLDDDTVVIADPGDALLAGADLFIQGRTDFISPAYYTSLGFAVPASLGVQLANPALRPLVLVGDGAFQMTGMELSTTARYGLNPIVVVLNNRGYGTERPMYDGTFNDVLPWRFDRLPEVLGAGIGYAVHMEDELDAALARAHATAGTFVILDVHLDPHDASAALRRLTASLARRVRHP